MRACTRRWATSARCNSSGTGTPPRTNGWHNLAQLRDPKFAGNVSILIGVLGNLPIEPGYFLIEHLPLGPRAHERLTRGSGEFVAAVFDAVDDVFVQLVD